MKDIKNRKFDYLSFIAILFVIIGLVVIFYFMFSLPFNDKSNVRDAELFGQYGDFVGGFIGSIFALAGFFLIYKTLLTQQDAIKQQDIIIYKQEKSFEQQRFETTFFNLLKSQSDIINNTKSYFDSFNGITTKVTNVAVGRDFFIYSKIELINIWTTLNSSEYLGYYDEAKATYAQYEIDELYDPNSPNFTHPEEAREIEEVKERNTKLSHTNRFYGINKTVWESVKEKDTKGKLCLMYGLYFQKYDYIVSHYFRHLYHILDFADKTEEKLISRTKDIKEQQDIKNDFQKYVSFIQAQMSSLELMLLYYNVLAFPKAMRLIVKYDFLENLAIENLIYSFHSCVDEIKLKSKKELIL